LKEASDRSQQLIAGRMRAPEGIAGEHLFQKHPKNKLPGLKALDPALWPGHTALFKVDRAQALVSSAQIPHADFDNTPHRPAGSRHFRPGPRRRPQALKSPRHCWLSTAFAHMLTDLTGFSHPSEADVQSLTSGRGFTRLRLRIRKT
jgi:hypothetical protein